MVASLERTCPLGDPRMLRRGASLTGSARELKVQANLRPIRTIPQDNFPVPSDICPVILLTRARSLPGFFFTNCSMSHQQISALHRSRVEDRFAASFVCARGLGGSD